MKINLISIKARANQLYQTWLELELWRWLSTVAFLVCHIPWGKRIKSPSFCFPSPGILWPNNSQTQLLASFIFPRFPLTLFPPSLLPSALLQFYFWHRLADADVSSVPNFVVAAQLHASCCSIPMPARPLYRRPCLLLSALLQLVLHPFVILLLFVANC